MVRVHVYIVFPSPNRRNAVKEIKTSRSPINTIRPAFQRARPRVNQFVTGAPRNSIVSSENIENTSGGFSFIHVRRVISPVDGSLERSEPFSSSRGGYDARRSGRYIIAKRFAVKHASVSRLNSNGRSFLAFHSASRRKYSR